MPNWCAPHAGVKVLVMALQGRKSSPQKSAKNEFKFWCELGWFLQRQSHNIICLMLLGSYLLYHVYALDKCRLRCDNIAK